ncbi:MAG: hypothetical protein ABIN48_09750 [Ginsengibacter sp.]
MNKILFILISVFITGICGAQSLSAEEFKILQKKEDSLKSHTLEIVRGTSAESRFKADSLFTRMFVRALQTKNSIEYPFDSLITISKLSPKDGSFKIYTWQLMITENMTRKHGAIQMKTNDGSLKLFPLLDMAEYIDKPADTITNNLHWVGAVYYQMIEKSAFGKKYYTLLGYDENNISSNKKIIDILTFEDGKPVFGGNNFSFRDNSIHKKSMARYIMEYKKHAGPRLTYDTEEDMIMIEHLISETGEPNKKYTLVGDGDYEGLKWMDGKWVHISKVFTQTTAEGQEPVPHPIRDPKGNIDESKLSQRLPDYMQEDSIPPVKKETSVKKKKKGKN